MVYLLSFQNSDVLIALDLISHIFFRDICLFYDGILYTTEKFKVINNFLSVIVNLLFYPKNGFSSHFTPLSNKICWIYSLVKINKDLKHITTESLYWKSQKRHRKKSAIIWEQWKFWILNQWEMGDNSYWNHVILIYLTYLF